MGSGWRQSVKQFVLWEYERGSWQYDVMVSVILAFVFLTPREWFRDQPRIANPSHVVKLPAEAGLESYWLESGLLANVPDERRAERAAELITARTGKKPQVVRVSAVRDEAEDELKGYLVSTRP